MNYLFKLLQYTYHYFYPPVKRKAIPKKIKDQVWIKYNGYNHVGKCYVCGCRIDRLNYHNAHVISHKDGGDISVDNLRPTCCHCNLSMGKKNLYTFKTNVLK